MLERNGDDLGLARAYLVLAGASWMSGQIEAAVEARQRAYDHAARAGDTRIVGRNLFWGAECYGPRPAVAAIDSLEPLLAAPGIDPMSRAQALFSLAGLYAMRGRADEARESYASLRTILDDLGATLWSAASHEIAAFAELALGDPERAEPMLDEGIVLLRRFDAVGYMTYLSCLKSLTLAELGRYQEAVELADQMIGEAMKDDVMDFVVAHTARSIAFRGMGSTDEAIEAARTALRVGEATDQVTFRNYALMALAEALDAAGDRDEANAVAREALDLCVAKENLMGEAMAARLLDRLAAAPG